MKQIKINLAEGQEIDLEKSDLSKGVISIKKVYNKYIKDIDSIYPKSFEELDTIKGYYIRYNSNIEFIEVPSDEINSNIFPKREQAEAVLALAQLLQLRDKWLEISGHKDWEPDYNVIDNKHMIKVINNKFIDVIRIEERGVLSFPTKQMTVDFIKTFEDLLETAKPLL